MLVLLAAAYVCNARKTPDRNRIQALVNEMRAEARRAGVDPDRETVTLPGIKVVSDSRIDMVSISGLSMKLGKAISGINKEIPAVRGIKSMLVLDYEECPEQIRNKFNDKLGRELKGCELLMEAKDGKEKMSIFGNSSADGSRISNIIMFAPQDGSLICFFGTISADDLAALVNSEN